MRMAKIFFISTFLFLFFLTSCSDSSNPVENTPNVISPWTKKANMSSQRAAFGSCVVDGKIYVIGGESMDGVLSSVEMYDPENDVWTSKQDMPTSRTTLSACTVYNKIYAIGGVHDVQSPVQQLSLVEEYDPNLEGWTQKAPMKKGRAIFGSCVFDNKIYVFGGGIDSSTSSVEMYDPLTDSWETKANMPTSRGDLAACLLGDKIYVMGGDQLVDTDWEVSRIVEVYDPTSDTWTQSASNMNIGRVAFSACSCNGKIFVFGGVGNVLSTSSESTEVYDSQSNTWSFIQKMPAKIIGHNSVVVQGIIYIIGGYSYDEYIRTLYAYDPEKDSF